MPSSSIPSTSTFDDPYHIVQQEIESALQAARAVCQSYIRIRKDEGKLREKESGQGRAADDAYVELQTALDGLEADLEDLEESVRIVSQPERARAFGLSELQVYERKGYIQKVRKELVSMRSVLSTSPSVPSTPTASHPLSPAQPSAYPLSPTAGHGHGHLLSPTASHPLSSTHPQGGSRTQSRRGSQDGGQEDDQSAWARTEQQMLLEQQDRTMDAISGTLTTLAEQAGLMGQEIEEHVEMLDDLEQNVDQSESKLSSAMKKMKRMVRETEETKSGWCIGVLVVVLVVLLFAVVWV